MPTDTTARGAISGAGTGDREMVRSIDWKGAFWVASGVPALVLFSLGGIAGVSGRLAFLVWAISILMGFLQSFTYAEIAGLFANKSGGPAVFGGTAWLRYSKFIAPLLLWCYWFAWSPVLSLGCALAAGYILNAWAPIPSFTDASPEVVAWLADPLNKGKVVADAIAAVTGAHTPAIQSWELLSFSVPGFGMAHLNSVFVIGVLIMLGIFAIQNRGIAGTANVQKWIGVIVIATLLVVGLLPILMGKINWGNFSPLVPPKALASAENGTWSWSGWTLFLGGLYIAAWSTYAFETAVCYTREFRSPKTDTFKAIFYSGLLCVVLFILVPFTFQGVLGLDGLLAGPIVAGSGIADAAATMVGGGSIVHAILVLLMIMALVLTIMTAMAGSSRTLYQGSVDGWLPKYLSKVNSHGAPDRAMWTDFLFNVAVLAIASDATGFFFVLAISNVGYMIFNFLNLNAGWMHRVDSGHLPRPWRAPTWLIGLNTVLAFANAVLLGAGAKTWGYSTGLWWGFGMALLIIPIFAYRHYVRDGGQFPPNMLSDMGLEGQDLGQRKAGVLPYVTIAAGLAVVLISNWLFPLPA
jgi:amino acid transporter